MGPRAGIRTRNRQAPSLIAVPTMLKEKVLRDFETLVTLYLSTLGNIPEHLNLQQYRCESLKRRIIRTVCVPKVSSMHHSACINLADYAPDELTN